MRKQEGFSLIELLVVVAIILIIAAIAIPNFVRSKMAANEASAAASLRVLTKALISYSSNYGNGAPPAIANLGPGAGDCNQADLIDSQLVTGAKSGYIFIYAGVIAAPVTNAACPAGFVTYTINANPVAVGTTGQRYFFVDQTGVIRFNMAAPAGPADPPIGG